MICRQRGRYEMGIPYPLPYPLQHHRHSGTWPLIATPIGRTSRCDSDASYPSVRSPHILGSLGPIALALSIRQLPLHRGPGFGVVELQTVEIIMDGKTARSLTPPPREFLVILSQHLLLVEKTIVPLRLVPMSSPDRVKTPLRQVLPAIGCKRRVRNRWCAQPEGS